MFVFADKTRNIYETSLETYNKLLHNPAKSDSGKISKLILDKINTQLSTILNVNQWRNTQNVIDWFGSIEEKSRHSFILFDIIDFYPSISENLLDQALSWASNLASISNEDISIIKHARKSLLFSNGKPWTKNNSSNLFDVTMGSYDGAEICELVGLFILKQLGKTFGNKNIGLYRDDGLAIIKNKSARLADKTRKELHKIFEQFGLKITAKANLHAVNFLDVTFDLASTKHRPYRKPNDDPLYIHKHSNHPPSILRQLPVSINKRISTLSSDKETFQDAAPTYQTALGHSNFAHKLEYMPHVTHQSRRNRQRNIIWFNPPFSKNIKTNIARNFLDLVDTHFPAGHKLHKIFNRNTVKVSYSCMNNVKNIISKHNTRIIRKSQPQVTNTTSCNCRNKETCPLQNKCMSKDIVYKATISTCNTNDTKHYIGMTSNTFKERYRNHIKSFNHKKYSNETELSKYVWHLKENNTDYTIKWSIIKNSISYTGGSKRCNLCLEEKLSILKEKSKYLLNKRSEIVSACHHKNKFQVNHLTKKGMHGI